jgi:hypothetical protein
MPATPLCSASAMLAPGMRLPPTDEERQQSYLALRTAVAAIEALRPGAVETATFLLDEAKTSFDRASSRSAALEAKATMLLGIVAGASGALGVFGFARDGKTIAFTLPVFAALIFAVAAMLCLLYLLRTKLLNEPDVGPFISVATLAEDNRPGLALFLATSYYEMTLQQLYDTRHEPRVWLAACLATAAAALLIIMNAIPHAGLHAPAHSKAVTAPRSVLQAPQKAATLGRAKGSLTRTPRPGATP